MSDDRQLLRAAVHRRDEDTVLRLTEGLARRVASIYYLPAGGDRDDLLQEARIGIVKAVRDFHGHPAAFIGFAELCARRQVITAVKTATRGKHQPLNQSTSIDAPLDHDPDAGTLADVIAFPGSDPADILDGRDELADFIDGMYRLTRIERAAVIGTAFEGRTYGDIAAHYGLTDRKAVDNALQRARHKLAA